ncbi:hypothetical protein PsorP6_007516 [Peronosclerospora sorghi]|uniref:Uncharacterized protein n=1 Tax=Peronosclerospora sorghi TaxID=230839 RepID=A0ACC0W965_9STRA|nr:hypothetical protein PsorP6_007516 [Peronosclerospora sorghi]
MEILTQDAIEFLVGRLFYVPLKKAPPRIPGTHFFSIDKELPYWNFYLDFGPLNLGHAFVFSETLNKKTGEVIYFYSSTQAQHRANAVCILGCWAVLFQRMSAKKAYEPFQHMRFPLFHDASSSVCSFNLTILDCLQGLERAIKSGYISTRTFKLNEFQHFERVENGDLTWVSPKFIAFAGPHNVYQRTPQGHVMLTPEHYIPYFKNRNVSLVVRLNTKQYDEKKFVSAGIDHLDLIYPDGKNAPMPLLLRFIEACEKTRGAVAVHCKAGLGRTGTCIGAYMMKHHLFSAHELIGWLRLCRPGSIIGPQQQFMEAIESRLHELHSKLERGVEGTWPSRPFSIEVELTKHQANNILTPMSPTRNSIVTTNWTIFKAPTNLDKKTQGDKLNDQKYMHCRGSKHSLPISSNLFW